VDVSEQLQYFVAGGVEFNYVNYRTFDVFMAVEICILFLHIMTPCSLERPALTLKVHTLSS
jgi:hypothetical protein